MVATGAILGSAGDLLGSYWNSGIYWVHAEVYWGSLGTAGAIVSFSGGYWMSTGVQWGHTGSYWDILGTPAGAYWGYCGVS